MWGVMRQQHSMKKRLDQKGQHTLLPIVGDSVVTICVSVNRDPEIVTADTNDQHSSIELSDRFTIGRGTNSQTIERHHQQSPFDGRTMSPLLELIGATVTGATAYSDGRLELSFSNSIILETASTTGYEAWHFQYPRAGRPPGGDVSNHISLHGAAGRLL